MKRILIVAVLTLWSGLCSAGMLFLVSKPASSVAFDQSSAGTPAVNTNGPVTWTHTPVGTPTAVAVLITSFGLVVDPTVTYGGASLGAYVVKQSSATPDVTYIYCLSNPSAGAQTVNVSWTGGSAYVVPFAVTVTGSSTSSCFSNSAGAAGNSTALSNTVTSAAGELVIDLADQDAGGTFTAGVGQSNVLTSNDGGIHAAISTKAGAASVTMTWTSTNSAPWANVAASFH